MIFAAVFIGMCMMLLSWPFMTLLDPYALALPDPIRWLGLTLLIAGLGLAAGGLIQLRGLENIDRLVATGLFARIRHPMYTGFILWIAGWMVFYGAAVSFIFGLIGVSSILCWRQMEERKLAAQFGDDYQRYIQQTWF